MTSHPPISRAPLQLGERMRSIRITKDGASIFPKNKRQGLELTGIYVSAIAAVIAAPQITWPQVGAIVALCFFGHVASTKGNR